jgi:BirA family transcriptional regulator, biotin operon repressor / biotin---[acetyl-CoA-carboxylase] ligase
MLRVYPALLSTEADAQAWARAGGPDGGLVIAGYQVSPRGRSGLEWRVRPDIDLAFSLVVRPELTAEDEGWLYTIVTSALADVLGGDAVVEWPDEVHGPAGRLAAVGVHAELGPHAVAWAVVNVLVSDVPVLAAQRGTPAARGELLAQTLEAIDARRAQSRTAVLEDYRSRCATFGRDVRARLIPVGPAGPVIAGRAVDAARDGALVLDTASGRRVAVRPQHLGMLESADVEDGEPEEIAARRLTHRDPQSHLSGSEGPA